MRLCEVQQERTSVVRIAGRTLTWCEDAGPDLRGAQVARAPGPHQQRAPSKTFIFYFGAIDTLCVYTTYVLLKSRTFFRILTQAVLYHCGIFYIIFSVDCRIFLQ